MKASDKQFMQFGLAFSVICTQCHDCVFHLAARVTGKSVIKKRRLDSDDESGRINNVSYVTLVVVPIITTVPLSSSTSTVIPSLYKSPRL